MLTPNLERAERAIRDGRGADARDPRTEATAALTAALNHPDEGRDPVAEALCSHDRSLYHMERTDDYPCSACVSAADAVRARILGEAV